MTARQGGKGKGKKLRLNRETLKDLDAVRKGARIKGGDIIVYGTVGCSLIYCATIRTNCNCGPPRATGNVWCL